MKITVQAAEKFTRIVSYCEDEKTGFVTLHPLESEFSACFLTIHVDPLWRGQGIGSALVNEVLRIATYDAVFAEDCPEFFLRFGFRSDLAIGYASARPNLMVRALHDIPATGRILFPPRLSGAGSSGPR